jgi:hypothetical protein
MKLNLTKQDKTWLVVLGVAVSGVILYEKTKASKGHSNIFGFASKVKSVTERSSSGGCNCNDGSGWYHTDCPCPKGEQQNELR